MRYISVTSNIRRQLPIRSRGRHLKQGQPFEFPWLVAKDHQWIEAKVFDFTSGVVPRTEGAYLVPLAAAGTKLYKPLESATGLFRDFSQLERTRAAIRRFANTYGMLGAGSTVVPSNAPQIAVASIGTCTARGKRKGIDVIPAAESCDFWLEEACAMHRAVQLWDALNSEVPQRELKAVIEWRDKNSVLFHSGGVQQWIATPVHHPELLPRLQYPDLVQPAWHQLQRLVGRNLKQFPACPQLLWENGELLLFIQPQSLIGGMWLQLALAIEGHRQYRNCPGCGRWFEVGGGRMRADAQTCSQTCRQRKNRKTGEQKQQSGRRTEKN